MRALLLAGVAAIGWAATTQAAPITYNAVNDFSTAANPNGVWSYGYGSGTTFTAFSTSYANFGGNAGYNYWGLSQNSVPLVGRNTQGIASTGTYQPPSNDLWLHPGNTDTQAAILRFTAQTTGSYSLSSLFERVDNTTNGTGVSISIYDNASLIYSTILLPSSGASTTFSSPLSLVAGDTLLFEVGRNGDYSFDSTGVRVTIANLPEPATLALLGTGILGLAAVRRRRD